MFQDDSYAMEMFLGVCTKIVLLLVCGGVWSHKANQVNRRVYCAVTRTRFRGLCVRMGFSVSFLLMRDKYDWLELDGRYSCENYVFLRKMAIRLQLDVIRRMNVPILFFSGREHSTGHLSYESSWVHKFVFARRHFNNWSWLFAYKEHCGRHESTNSSISNFDQ